MSHDSKILRNALGSFATGVTIVTTRTLAGEDVGRTANSFSSVSLDPPMILWSLAKTSTSLDAFRDTKHFAVHILSAEQDGLSGIFASRKEDKFADLDIERGDDGIPLLKNCAARFACRTAHQYEGGDHVIFVGEVVDFQHSETPPLVFHGGAYGMLVRKAHDLDMMAADRETSLSPDDFIYLISRVFYRIRRDAVAERQKRGWSGAEYAVLTLLGHEDGRSIAKIQEIGRSRGDEITVESIDKLVRRKLVYLSQDDQPEQVAFLTGEGRSQIIEIVAMLKAAEADCLAHLDRSELLIIKQLLHRMAHAEPTGWPPLPSAASKTQDQDGGSPKLA
jgi:3-hydroxy-9,10-secoandrosta-1,3,5(10)-triene-9,17-dione monooxygenase reductase component